MFSVLLKAAAMHALLATQGMLSALHNILLCTCDLEWGRRKQLSTAIIILASWNYKGVLQRRKVKKIPEQASDEDLNRGVCSPFLRL